MEKRFFKLLPLAYLVSSRRASFRVTFSAVYWPGSVGLEWNLTFLAAISADRLVSLSVSIHTLFQLLIFCCAKITSHTRSLRFAPMLINYMPEVLKNTVENNYCFNKSFSFALVNRTILSKVL